MRADLARVVEPWSPHRLQRFRRLCRSCARPLASAERRADAAEERAASSEARLTAETHPVAAPGIFGAQECWVGRVSGPRVRRLPKWLQLTTCALVDVPRQDSHMQSLADGGQPNGARYLSIDSGLEGHFACATSPPWTGRGRSGPAGSSHVLWWSVVVHRPSSVPGRRRRSSVVHR